MSDYFDRIERHLTDAVARHYGPQQRFAPAADGGRLGAFHRGRATIVLAVVVAGVAAAVVVVFATSIRGPSHAPNGQPAVVTGGPRCGVAGARRLAEERPKPLLSILGVLRGPQRPYDGRALPITSVGRMVKVAGGPQAVRAENNLPARDRVEASFTHVYSRYIRRVQLGHGRVYFLVPFVTGANFKHTSQCVHPLVGLLHGDYQRAGDGISVGCCETRATILAGDAGSTSAAGGRTSHGSGDGGGSTLSFIVPDQVASVTLRFRSSTVLRRPSHSGSERVRVAKIVQANANPVGNVVAVTVPAGVRDAFERQTIWRSASGKVIKIIRPRAAR